MKTNARAADTEWPQSGAEGAPGQGRSAPTSSPGASARPLPIRPGHALPSIHTAQWLLARGQRAEAEAELRGIIEAEPDSVSALDLLSAILRRTGRLAEALPLRRRMLQIELGRRGLDAETLEEVLRFRLAAEGAMPAPEVAPPAHVAALFDAYADTFDAALTDVLRYRAPQLLHESVRPFLPPADATLDVLDLGCGTGLAGPWFRGVARRLDGVDLSAAMLAKAEQRAVYDHLDQAELSDFLRTTPLRYDLLVAADVVVYFGDLSAVFEGCRRVLRSPGWLAFSVEAAADASDYFLQATRRYVHGEAYLRAVAARAGFDVLHLEEAVVRFEAHLPVRSFVCVLVAGAGQQAGEGRLTSRERKT